MDRLNNDFKDSFQIVENAKRFIDDFITDFNDHTQDELRPTYQTIFNYNVGIGKNIFCFGFSYLLYTKNGVENSPQFKLIENIPCIGFTLNGSNDRLYGKKTKSYYVVPNNLMTLQLYEGDDLRLIKEITVREILDMVEKSITNQEVWELIYS